MLEGNCVGECVPLLAETGWYELAQYNGGVDLVPQMA